MSWALIPLSEEQQEIQRTAREFARAEIAPHSVAWDRDSFFDRNVIGKMGELGFLGMMLPEEFGGLALPTTTYLVALEEIAAAAASITCRFHSSPSPCATRIVPTVGRSCAETWAARRVASATRGRKRGSMTVVFSGVGGVGGKGGAAVCDYMRMFLI